MDAKTDDKSNDQVEYTWDNADDWVEEWPEARCNTSMAKDVGKRLLNAPLAAQRQLEPIKYQWAHEMFLAQSANFWLPTEIPMGSDLQNLRDMSPDCLHAAKTAMAMFATVEFEVAGNLEQNLYRLITNPECRMFLLAQGNIEAIHQWAYSLCVEHLGLDKQEMYSAHSNVPSIKAKMDWCDEKTSMLMEPGFDVGTIENKRTLLLNIIAYLLVEGIGFYGGFAIIANFLRRNLLVGTGKQIQFIARDENLHCQFATKLAIELIREEPGIWDERTAERTVEMAREIVGLESNFCYHAIGMGIEGLPFTLLDQHLGALARKRLSPFGIVMDDLPKTSALPWLSEILETRKEENFFETTVSNYKRGGLVWED